MPARQFITTEAILEAITRWRGNVQAAADSLRIRPKNLRERLARVGIGTRELGAIRTGTYQPAPTRTGPHDPYLPVGAGPYGPKSEGDPVTSFAEARNVSRVSGATAAMVTEIGGAPLPKNPRVETDHLLRLQRLKWTMSAMLRRDLTESDVLKMVLEEALPAFEERAQRVATTPPAPEKPGPRRVRKPRTEDKE